MKLFSIDAHDMYSESPTMSMFPPHTHEQHEIHCFLSGDISFSVEGSRYSLHPGDIFIIRARETHQVILNKEGPYHRMVVNFSSHIREDDPLFHACMDSFYNRPLGMCNYYPAIGYRDSDWTYYLKKICHTEDPVRQQTYLMIFLQELSDSFARLQQEPITQSPTTLLPITHYIDRHLTDTLNLDILCNRFFISKSQLTRIFKKNLSMTVGEYINTKRLVLAKQMISSGQAPSTVYAKCGFRDYSTFFRAYKKKFGYGPANKPNK